MSNVQWETTIKADATTEDTLEAIVGFINKYCTSPFVEDVVEVTKEQSGGINTGDFLKNLFAWACDNIDYKLDSTGTEELHTPELSWKNGLADCKKYSILLGSVCEAAGLNPICKWVEYSDNTAWTHIFIIIPLAGFDPAQRSTYIVLDPTNDCQYNTEVSYKKAVLYYLNGDTMELKGMGAKPKPNYGHYNFTQPHFEMGMAGANVLSKMRGPSGSAGGSNGQAWVAFLSLIHQNVGGLANTLVKDLAANPSALDAMAAQFGQDPNQIANAALEGMNVTPLPITALVNHINGDANTEKPVSGGWLNTRWSSVAGQAQVGVVSANPAVVNIPSHYVGKGNPAVTDPQTVQLMNWYIACVNNGQDLNGYYGAFQGGQYGTNANADAEMRSWYNSLMQAGTPQGYAGVTPNSGALPAPLAKGAAITGSVNVKSTGSAILNVAGPAIAAASNAILPGSGAIVGALIGAAANLTSPNNANTNTIPTTVNTVHSSFIGSVGGFFFKAMLLACLNHSTLIASAALLITIGLLIKKHTTLWKKQLAH